MYTQNSLSSQFLISLYHILWIFLGICANAAHVIVHVSNHFDRVHICGQRCATRDFWVCTVFHSCQWIVRLYYSTVFAHEQICTIPHFTPSQSSPALHLHLYTSCSRERPDRSSFTVSSFWRVITKLLWHGALRSMVRRWLSASGRVLKSPASLCVTLCVAIVSHLPWTYSIILLGSPSRYIRPERFDPWIVLEGSK